jgi:predicted house-cleaning noncanonical NTP pyrophosphatase (MazG superfamily)
MMQGSNRIIGARPFPLPPVAFKEFRTDCSGSSHSTILGSRRYRPVTYTASIDENGTRLRDKLREEAEEFLASDNDPEELADVLEVLYALAEQAGTDRRELEKLRAAKAEECGSFANRCPIP